jgi:hypothetical protein
VRGISLQFSFHKGGQGGFLAGLWYPWKILAADCGSANPGEAPEKRSITHFSNQARNSKLSALRVSVIGFWIFGICLGFGIWNFCFILSGASFPELE